MEMLKSAGAGVLELQPHPARALQTTARAMWRVLDSGLALVRRSSVRVAAPRCHLMESLVNSAPLVVVALNQE
jgi:hypothetical protein